MPQSVLIMIIRLIVNMVEEEAYEGWRKTLLTGFMMQVEFVSESG